jgi:hypothetical protein
MNINAAAVDYGSTFLKRVHNALEGQREGASQGDRHIGLHGKQRAHHC